MVTKLGIEVYDVKSKYFIFSGIVLISAIFLFYYFVTKSDSSYDKHNFEGFLSDATGLNNDANIKIGGLNIGKVINMSFVNNEIKILGSVSDEFQIPIDSFAKILTDGYFGDKYIQIIPGFSDEKFKEKIILKNISSGFLIDDVVRYISSEN